MDEADYANQRMEQELGFALRAARVNLDGPGRADCEECGAEIPEARRQAVPSVRHCIGCAESIEFAARLRR